MFIADLNNNCIVVLNPDKLDTNASSDDVSENDVSRVLPVSVDGGLRQPCLWLDESHDRLYNNGPCRVFVVDNVYELMF